MALRKAGGSGEAGEAGGENGNFSNSYYHDSLNILLSLSPPAPPTSSAQEQLASTNN
ncbi:MAG: hypothetical protein KME32_28935 [Mojavia pulchra JT2-VF2]|jgi:hypothetical protein|uniref:Uncharacterized protein n=1 Tax=Mojavia pulchra JT2-VF2 TaxID=287848 RepID=A0A951UIT4_9NOST|nr:hypothetical protein [Mojavia pulchra JT2-VF2]